MSTTPVMMLQGTGSDVGKSLLTAGLGRAYLRHGLKVRPFKPQNMSNNAAVTTEGGEMLLTGDDDAYPLPNGNYARWTATR